jgi:hypothetical protein
VDPLSDLVWDAFFRLRREIELAQHDVDVITLSQKNQEGRGMLWGVLGSMLPYILDNKQHDDPRLEMTPP